MRRVQVLVADDFEEMRQLVVRTLSQHCAVVGSVADGKALLDAAASLRPDVIVSDISMPRLTGPAAIRELRARGLNIPVVLMSANIADVDDYIEAGATALVDKVDIKHELLPAVDAACTGERYFSRHVRALLTPDCPGGSVLDATSVKPPSNRQIKGVRPSRQSLEARWHKPQCRAAAATQ